MQNNEAEKSRIWALISDDGMSYVLKDIRVKYPNSDENQDNVMIQARLLTGGDISKLRA